MTPRSGDAVARRTVDVVASAAGLAVLALPLAAIAVAVKATSPGPALYTQVRVGRDGEPFTLLKFRSMRAVAPGGTAAGPQVTAGGDPRITRVGAFLREWKLDELPQLFNVLRGDMSLVGPRPEVPKYADLWPADARATILTVRPGITDPVTVTLRDEESLLADQDDPESYYVNELLPQKAAAYAEYVSHRSFASDLGTILGTLKAVVKR